MFLRVVSHPEIEESVDVLLRRVEAVAFGGDSSTPSNLKLCFGSARTLDSESCKKTDILRDQLDKTDSLNGLMKSLRVTTLFFGPVQCLTLAIFIFALIQTFGMYARWVLPSDHVLKVDFSETGFETVSNSDKATLEGLIGSRARYDSIGDRMFLRVLKSLGAAPKGDGAQRESLALETLSGYRDYLVEDATVRQDQLEMLGDTLLKVAFMGTVYGISAALFAARELDASDPLIRLSAKAHMYAGIGVGFGATLVGIALSIIAAMARTWLLRTWLAGIGRGYRLLLEYPKGAPTDIPEVPGGIWKGHPPEPPTPRQSFILQVLQRAGLVVVLVIVGYLVYKLLLVRIISN